MLKETRIDTLLGVPYEGVGVWMLYEVPGVEKLSKLHGCHLKSEIS